MKKTVILCCLILAFGWVGADEAANPSLKANHDEMIRHFGDVHFLKGLHYFGSFQNVFSSVYTVENQKCVYAELNERKLYRVIVSNSGANKVSLSFTDKITHGGKTYTMGYSISYIVSDKSSGYFVTLDKERTDLAEARADWEKLLACVLKYAEELYGAVKNCIQNQNIIECLKIIGPAMDVYKCLSSEWLSSLDNRAIVTQNIYFSWSWGYSTGFKAAPIYKEMPNTIIGFDSVSISSASNAWNIQIGGEVTGNNVAKVYLANVTYMCYPTFWSSSVSGTVRCVMQK